jgi:hypothetical protein
MKDGLFNQAEDDMGYRSEVSFCLKVKDPEKFKGLMLIKDDPIINEFLENMVLVGGEFYFYSQHWKWYPDSEKAFLNLLNMAEDYDEEFACKFARIGEESDDIEDQAFGDDGWDLEYPHTVRSLELGCDFDKYTRVKER